jgi:hypothetical protein
MKNLLREQELSVKRNMYIKIIELRTYNLLEFFRSLKKKIGVKICYLDDSKYVEKKREGNANKVN